MRDRYKIASKSSISTGKVKIEVITKYDSNERMAPATVTFLVNGNQVGQGRIERSVPVFSMRRLANSRRHS
jgi:arylsulfatase